MATTYNDGSAAAPSGTPLLPNLLTGYAVRPPWQVAGVDYAVGVPAGTVLQDPATISKAGVSVSAASHTITINASNVTLSGYDFGRDGGWGIVIAAGVTDTVIQNSHFLVGANNKVPVNAGSGSGNLTLTNNTFDGGGGNTDVVWALVSYYGSGTLTATYNSFLNAPADAIDLNSGTMTSIVKYNVFENLGTAPGSHPDTVQYVGVRSNNSVESFNTIYQPTSSGLEGIQLQAQLGSTLTDTTLDNNVIIAKGPSIDMSYSIAVIQNSGNTISGAHVGNNYIDTAGAYGPFYPPSGSNLVFDSNVNLRTGALFANPPGTTTAGTPPPQNTVVSVKASPATGTEEPGNVITLTLTMAEAFNVIGTPSLLLNDGGRAVYTGGSGSSTLAFNYTVANTDSAVSSLAVTGVSLPAGTTVTDASGTAANFAGAVTSFPGLGIVPSTPVQPAPGPVVGADSASTATNQPVTIPVLTTDSDVGGTLVTSSVQISTAPAHGATVINTTTGAITYTPAAGYIGKDTFQYTVADTAGIRSAPATVTVSVAAAGGYADGAAGAPADTPQLPDILKAYAVRPPWAVAGVDYAVGVPAGVSLKDPTVAGALPTGATYNSTSHTVTVSGDNVVLTGFDFSLHGGTQLVVQSNNVTVQNSRFAVGPNQGSLGRVVFVTPTAGNVAFLSNEFNGNSAAVTPQQGQMMMVENHGIFTFNRNYVHDTGGDAIDFGSGPQSEVINYNVFQNIGVTSAHADTLQWYNSQVTSGVIAFNTVYQSRPQPGPGNGGLTLLSEGPSATMSNMLVENDTIIQTNATSSTGATTGNFTTGFYADLGGKADHVTIHDLYIDPTGPLSYTGMWLLPTGYYGYDLANPTVISNVTNMVSGTTYTSLPKAQSYYVAPAANGVSPVLGDVLKVTASPGSGTKMPGDAINFTLSMDEPFNVTGQPALILNDGGKATYLAGSGTSTLNFLYRVGTSDSTVGTLAISSVALPAGAAVKDAMGNAANLSGAITSFPGLGVDPPGPTSNLPTNAGMAVQPATDSGSTTAPLGSLLNDTVLSGNDLFNDGLWRSTSGMGSVANQQALAASLAGSGEGTAGGQSPLLFNLLDPSSVQNGGSC